MRATRRCFPTCSPSLLMCIKPASCSSPDRVVARTELLLCRSRRASRNGTAEGPGRVNGRRPLAALPVIQHCGIVLRRAADWALAAMSFLRPSSEMHLVRPVRSAREADWPQLVLKADLRDIGYGDSDARVTRGREASGVRLRHRGRRVRRRRTCKHGEAVKPVSQVLELVDGNAEVAIELAEHLLCSRP